MGQRSIVAFLHLKGLSAKAKDVHTELVQVLGSNTIAYSIVTKCLRNDVILQNEREVANRVEDRGFSIKYNAILETLEMMLFASIHQIATMTFILPVTGFCRFTKSFHFVLKRLRWVPHRLLDLHKQAQIIMSKELLRLLESM
jgi:hypothetical protein